MNTQHVICILNTLNLWNTIRHKPICLISWILWNNNLFDYLKSLLRFYDCLEFLLPFVMALYFTDISLSFWTVTVTSTTSYPSKISVKLDLKVGKINATWLRIDWRKFTEFELQFIDGVQLRYKEPHAQVANTTIISFCNVYETFEKIEFRRYPPMKLVCQFCNEILKLLEGKETKHTCLPNWKLWVFNHLPWLTFWWIYKKHFFDLA